MEKMEIMKTIADEVKAKCEENEIEYVLVQSAKEAGEFISHSAVTNAVLKEMIDVVKKVLPAVK